MQVQSADNSRLIIVVGIIAVVVGFVIFYFRDYIGFLNKGPQKTQVDEQIEALLDNIRQLARSHEYNKAGLLIWNTFTVAAGGFLGMDRAPSQTGRAFALSMLSFDGITQETVTPVYELFEKSRYSGEEISLQEFNSGLTGLHRYLQVANQISSQMSGESSESSIEEEEEIVGGDEGDEDEDGDDE